jgi:NAD(P)H-hydrate epimerase
MQLPPLTREQVRSIDRRAFREFYILSTVLMENAGRGCADCLCDLGIDGKVVIACGKGNNAGDGFVMARHLDARGFDVVILLGAGFSELHGDASTNFLILKHASVPVIPLLGGAKGTLDRLRIDHEANDADWVVDALLGTGALGNPRPPISDFIDWLNASKAKKLAIDLPSGLDCDTGIPGMPTFRADHTCTFVAPKVGFANPAAKEFLGTVSVHDIGVPRKLLEEIVRK